MAEKAVRLHIYLAGVGTRTAQGTREIVQADGIEASLVSVVVQLVPCKTFSLRFQQGHTFVNRDKRKCLHIYRYSMDRGFGLIHVMSQTWCPMRTRCFAS